MEKRAFVTGIGGQDGYFMAQLLLERGYTVLGLGNVDVQKLFPTDDLVYKKVSLVKGDLLEPKFLEKTLREFGPQEIYHFAAQSDVGASYTAVQETYRVNTVGSMQLFEIAQHVIPEARIYFAGSSEMFGNAPASPQNEQTPFRPKSPYGMSKVAAYYSAKYHRESCGQFIATGITYNHESERRPIAFVTQKICFGLARIAAEKEKQLELGNLTAVRDWGFAGDYVTAMYGLLQLSEPIDAIIATGKGRTVEQFVNAAAHALGMELEWKGQGLHRRALNDQGKVIVKLNKSFYRESENVPLVGDSRSLQKEVGWKPQTTFQQLVNRMIRHAVAAVAQEV